MTRYLCPKCEGGGVILLEDDLSCSFCKGKYIWEDSQSKDKGKKEK